MANVTNAIVADKNSSKMSYCNNTNKGLNLNIKILNVKNVTEISIMRIVCLCIDVFINGMLCVKFAASKDIRKLKTVRRNIYVNCVENPSRKMS